MDTLILKGKAVSLKVKDELSSKITDLKSKDITPSLAAIIVGDNPASKLYVSSKAKAFSKLGCYSKVFSLPKDTSKEVLINSPQLTNFGNEEHTYQFSTRSFPLKILHIDYELS